MQMTNAAQFLNAIGRSSLQAGVLVLVVLLAQWLFRKHLTPRWRSALWLLVVLRLLLPISLSSTASIFNILPRFSGGEIAASSISTTSQLINSHALSADLAPVTEPRVEIQTTAPLPSTFISPKPAQVSPLVTMIPTLKAHSFFWLWLMIWFWISGALVLLAHMAFSACKMGRRFGKLPPLKDPSVLALLEECRHRLGVRQGLVLVESSEIISPALFGLFHPRMLLPKNFTVRFSECELRFVFLHELAHLKRRDLPVQWLFALLQALHWFNPMVWLAFARWRIDRELACDARALEAAGSDQNKAYGSTILRLLEEFNQRPVAPGIVGILEDKRQLRRRIEMIAHFKRPSRWSALAIFLLAIIAVGCLTDPQRKKDSGQPANLPVADSPVAKEPLTLDLARYQKPLSTINGETSMFTSITGRQTFDGLPFQIDGQAILFGRCYASRSMTSYPESLDGIHIGRKFDELHLIHYDAWLDVDGVPLARIRLNYSDGSKYEYSINYGGEVRDWYQQITEEKEQVADPNTKIIWRSTGTNSPLGCLRLFKTLVAKSIPQQSCG